MTVTVTLTPTRRALLIAALVLLLALVVSVSLGHRWLSISSLIETIVQMLGGVIFTVMARR